MGGTGAAVDGLDVGVAGRLGVTVGVTGGGVGVTVAVGLGVGVTVAVGVGVGVTVAVGVGVGVGVTVGVGVGVGVAQTSIVFVSVLFQSWFFGSSVVVTTSVALIGALWSFTGKVCLKVLPNSFWSSTFSPSTVRLTAFLTPVLSL